MQCNIKNKFHTFKEKENLALSVKYIFNSVLFESFTKSLSSENKCGKIRKINTLITLTPFIKKRNNVPVCNEREYPYYLLCDKDNIVDKKKKRIHYKIYYIKIQHLPYTPVS